MARDIPAANSNHLSVSDAAAPTLDITGTALTVACRFLADAVGTSFRGLVNKGDATATGIQWESWVSATSKLEFVIGDATSLDAATGATDVTTGVWHAFAGVKDGTGANAIRVYLDGALDGQNTSDRSIQNTAHGVVIGNRSANDIPWDGLIAEAAVWAVALSAAEIASLAKGFSPAMIRPQSLRGYWPLIGNVSPEPDLRNGNNLTITGTVAKAAHPRVIRPRPAIYVP